MRRNGFCLSIWIIALCCVAGCSGSSNANNGGGVNNQLATLTLTPLSATVSVFGTQPFTATVSGSSNTGVTWRVNGVTGGSQTTGYISNTGMYVAPSGVPTKSDGMGDSVVTTVMITAVAQANSNAVATATVTVTAPNENAQTGAITLGTSGGNVNDKSGKFCCGGTLGSLVARNGTQYILSNNHVLAKSDSGIVGDAISQPGIIDATSPCTTAGTVTVANLSEFFNLETGPTPKVDAALAQVVSGQVDPNGKVLFLGDTQTNGVPNPAAVSAGTGVPPTVGQSVAKSGRTTGLTCSTVVGIAVQAPVDYFKNCGDTIKSFTVNYTNLVSVAGGGFSAAGDSGSLIVTQGTADPVALLFGGSDMDSVGNPISEVLAAFPGAGNATPTFVGGAAHQVIGCTLPTVPQSAVVAEAQVASAAMQAATLVRDLRAPELLANPGIHAIGLGRSYDDPGQAAILLFLRRGNAQAVLPVSLDGVRTRVIDGEAWTYRGLLSKAETAEMLQEAAEPQVGYELRAGETERAKKVLAGHSAELLKNPSVLGVGVTSSVDSPGEAALLIYVKRGAGQNLFAAEMDGLRTRIRETGPFVAGRGNGGASQGCKARAILNERLGEVQERRVPSAL